MDIYCKRCGEPWELECLHELAEQGSEAWGGQIPETPKALVPAGSEWTDAKKAFFTYGCEAFGLKKCETRNDFRAHAMDALSDLCGDDIDGLASDLEDAFSLFG